MIQSHVKMGRGLNDDNTEFAEITLREMGLCRGKWLRTQHCYLKRVRGRELHPGPSRGENRGGYRAGVASWGLASLTHVLPIS